MTKITRIRAANICRQFFFVINKAASTQQVRCYSRYSIDISYELSFFIVSTQTGYSHFVSQQLREIYLDTNKQHVCLISLLLHIVISILDLEAWYLTKHITLLHHYITLFLRSNTLKHSTN